MNNLMNVDALIFLGLFFLGALVLTAYTYSGSTPMPRLSFLGKVLFLLANAGIFLSLIGFTIGWAKPEGGGLLMLLSVAGFFISVAINFKLFDVAQ